MDADIYMFLSYDKQVKSAEMGLSVYKPFPSWVLSKITTNGPETMTAAKATN